MLEMLDQKLNAGESNAELLPKIKTGPFVAEMQRVLIESSPSQTAIWTRSQAARQGLAVLMASASVVLKHETSKLCNKTSLSRKPSISDKTLPRNTIRKSRSLFHNPS